MEKVGRFFIHVIFMVIGFVGTLLALKNMWLWYIVPLGMPMLSLAHLYGIDLFVTFLVSSIDSYDIVNQLDEDQKLIKSSVAMIVPWLFLLFAWIAKAYM